ncbi:MAG: hypothetical protein MI919_36250, partial [Holophagales bacterium]|nr:hypothetical protein [Holophagales bacterium]
MGGFPSPPTMALSGLVETAPLAPDRVGLAIPARRNRSAHLVIEVRGCFVSAVTDVLAGPGLTGVG